jgi:hypothetical protein
MTNVAIAARALTPRSCQLDPLSIWGWWCPGSSGVCAIIPEMETI